MNFFQQFLTGTSVILILTFIVILAGIYIYQLYSALDLTKNTQTQLKVAENKLLCLEKSLCINNLLNIALINSCQTKNNIDLCNLLLDGCTHKSDLLTAKAVENSLHSQINNAIAAIKMLEEKRAFLESKIKDAFEAMQQTMQVSELEHRFPYAQVLLEESSLEFVSTEQMKHDVLKVNQVLDSVLLKT